MLAQLYAALRRVLPLLSLLRLRTGGARFCVPGMSIVTAQDLSPRLVPRQFLNAHACVLLATGDER